ncbi:MAG TPA: dihydroxyacetone kinase subunit L [Thermoanaerobacterales bacterium]|uniref:dihydroxyacetone kinase subunit DhaL n=1 Tax=Tepidanaerobacter sp. GT38 TaxID=2722793 RepID=UPI0017D54747|nr:dihydroxyacetone kinase subunit DhaL [Tepidanaerobacter sp. GT38]MCG1013354.1 dihydroxyacetone kinase subunit L [Tepidanaerobacter sp. GT38]HHY41759.1 dihydroxyacetone kinase subunit L [Thermoanaerobacterales bacterium]
MYTDCVIGKEYFYEVIEKIAGLIEEKRDYLTELDAAIGDADHGFNMSIGFREVLKKMPEWKDKDIKGFFRSVGMTLLGKVGGASGPLYGSFFMKFGEPGSGKNEVTFQELFEMFKQAVQAVEQRGKAAVGEKTMVDALRPALNAFEQAVEQNLQPKQVMEAFVDAARQGANSTIEMIAKKGRAMRLGERSKGHLDPGATSATMILEVFLECFPY